MEHLLRSPQQPVRVRQALFRGVILLL